MADCYATDPGRHLDCKRWYLCDKSSGDKFKIYIPQEEITWSKSINWADVGIGGVITRPIEHINGAPFEIGLRIFMDCTSHNAQAGVDLTEDIERLKKMTSHILRLIIPSSGDKERYNVAMTNLSVTIKQRHVRTHGPVRAVAEISLKQV